MWSWRYKAGPGKLLSGGERRYRGGRGCLPAPALRACLRVERVEDSLPPFIAAHHVDRAIEDKRRIERESDAGSVPQGLAPENRAILATERIDSVGTDGDVEDILGNGG